jgi:hypothetical protein
MNIKLRTLHVRFTPEQEQRLLRWAAAYTRGGSVTEDMWSNHLDLLVNRATLTDNPEVFFLRRNCTVRADGAWFDFTGKVESPTRGVAAEALAFMKQIGMVVKVGHRMPAPHKLPATI